MAGPLDLRTANAPRGTTDPEAAPAIALDDVRVTYRRGHVAVESLRGVSFAIAPGEFIAIVGPSGAGKSTLLRVMAGLWPPDAGRIVLGGTDLASCSDAKLAELRRRQIGFVHQHFNLLPDLTALDNVALPLLLDGVSPRAAEARAQSALARLGVGALGPRRPEELSGGEMLRVALARARVIDPLVVLADEPTGSLDRDNGRRVVEMLRDLNRRDGATIAMVTHDPEVAAAATRTLHIVDGRLVA